MRALPFDYAARNLGRRPLRTLLTAGSSALVAALLVATAAFVRGLEATFSGAARDDVVLLLSRSAEGDIVRSAIASTVGNEVSAAPSFLLPGTSYFPLLTSPRPLPCSGRPSG